MWLFRRLSFSLWCPPLDGVPRHSVPRLRNCQNGAGGRPCLRGRRFIRINRYNRSLLTEKTRACRMARRRQPPSVSASTAVRWERGWRPSLVVPGVSGDGDLRPEPLTALQEWANLLAGGGCLMGLIRNPKAGISAGGGTALENTEFSCASPPPLHPLSSCYPKATDRNPCRGPAPPHDTQ